MSPEQARGETSVRSDIYSLGSTLYEAITYRPLFQGDHISLMYQIFNDEPLLPRKLNPGISPYLEAICLKCLHRKSEKRYKSFRQLSSDLKNFKAHRPIRAKKYNQWDAIANFVQRKKTLCTFIVLALLVTVGAFAYISNSNRKLDMKNKEIILKNKEIIQKNKEVTKENTEKDIHRILENLSLLKQYLLLRDYSGVVKYFQNAKYTLKNSKAEKILKKDVGSDAIDKDLQAVLPFLPVVLQTIENYVFPYIPVPKKQKLDYYKILNTLQPSPYLIAYLRANKTVIEHKISKKEIIVEEIFDCVSFSNDGSTVALYKENKLRILETKTKRFVDVSIEDEQIEHMKISFDNRFVYLSGKEGVLFDRYEQILSKVKNGVPCFRRDNETLVIGEPIKNLGKKSEFLILPSLKKMRLADDSEKLYAKSLNFHYNTHKRESLLITTHINDIEIYTISPKDNQISVQKKSIIANAYSGKCLKAEISPNGKILATLGLDDKLKIWDLVQLRKIWELPIQTLQKDLIAKDVNHMYFSQDSNQIDLIIRRQKSGFICSFDLVKFDKVLDFKRKKNENPIKKKIRLLQKSLDMRSEKQFQIAISSEGKQIAYYLLPSLFLWNIKSEKLTTFKEGVFLGDCRVLKFSNDQRYLFYVGKFGRALTFYCWDLESKKEVFKKTVEQVKFVANSDLLFIRYSRKSDIRELYRFEKGTLKRISQITNNVEICAFNNKTKQIVYADYWKPFIWLFPIKSGKTREIKLHKYANKITALYFVNDEEIIVGNGNGYIFIVNSRDGTVKPGPKIYKRIQHFFFDGRAYFAKTKQHLYLLPPLWDFEGKLLHVLPLPIIGGNYYQALEANRKLKNVALLKRTGEVLFWSLGK